MSPHGRYGPVPENYNDLMDAELKRVMEFPGFTADNMSKLKKEYLASGALPHHTRYGWLRTRV